MTISLPPLSAGPLFIIGGTIQEPNDVQGSTTVDLGLLVIGDSDAAGGETIVISPSQDATVPGGKPTVLAEVVALLELAKEAHKEGNLALLKQHLEAILAIDPDNATAHFNLGVLARDDKQLPVADAHFRRATKLDPKNAQYHLAAGELMVMMRHLLFAAAAYEAALALSPNDLMVIGKLVDVRQKLRMPHEVVALCRRGLALNPQAVNFMISLGVALLWLGEAEEAAETIERAALLDPHTLATPALLHVAAKRSGRETVAEACMDQLEQRSTELWEQCQTATELLAQVDESEAAVVLLRRLIAKRSNFVPALQLLGRYLIQRGDVDEGFDCMRRVTELNPEEGDAQTSVCLTMIRNGEFAEGWARHYWRWKRTGCEPRWDPAPLVEWDGSPLPESGVVLWREQGIGDMVMYVAPAIVCRSLVKAVVLETNQRLRTLLRRSFPDMLVICREDMPESFFADVNVTSHLPIGDLPHVLHLDMENYPGRDGFLVPHAPDVARLRDRYKLLFPGKKLVGISWRSGNSSSAVSRSVDLPLWMPIFETPDCAFISLQYGDVSKDVNALREATGIDVYMDSDVDAMQDMDLFAAQIAAVDLVISVDNSTVHMSGALGKETLVFVPASADWRWLRPERTDTVWYSSLTLLRQRPKTDWTETIAAAATRLGALTQSEIDAAERAFAWRCAQQSEKYGGDHAAENYFRQILKLDSDHYPSLAGLGRIALQTGHIEAGIGMLRRAAEGVPDNADYHFDLAKGLAAGSRLDEAFASIRRCLTLDPTHADALTLGIDVLRQLKRAEEAANYCARLLRIDPAHREARLHLAQLQAGAGDFDVAEGNFRRVLEADTDNAAAAFALGCLALRREDMVAGWAGYARRFDAGVPKPLVDLKLPPLQDILDQPAALKEARVVVRPEPALKEQMLFMRWIPALRRDTGFVMADLDPRLVPLMDQRAARISLQPAGSLTVEDASDLNMTHEIAMGDLGQLYGRDIARLSDGAPYLQFERDRAATLRRNYQQALSCEHLVGICWRGGEMAVPLAEWLPILGLAGFGFVSLQVGPAQQEMHEVFDGLSKSAIRDPSIDAQSNLRAFAAQIAAVDAVVSIDEVPAHLAGALGVPTFCLLPAIADWRWFGETRQDSPWYPGMRLHRPAADGGWVSAMTEIAEGLELLAAGKDRGGNA